MATNSPGRKWAPRLDWRWETIIASLVDGQHLRSAKQVRERLKRETKKDKSVVYGLGDSVPNIRTIQKRLRLLVPDDGTGPWTMAEATEGEAAAVMPVLAAIAERAEGRVPTFSRGLAHLISCVHAAAPRLDAWTVYEVALAYWRRGDKPTEDLDLVLALRPWTDWRHATRYWNWLIQYRPLWAEPQGWVQLEGVRMGLWAMAKSLAAAGLMADPDARVRELTPKAHEFLVRRMKEAGIYHAKAFDDVDAMTEVLRGVWDDLAAVVEASKTGKADQEAQGDVLTQADNAEGGSDSAAVEGADGSAQV